MRFILIAIIVFGCSQQESVEVPRFSGVKAFQYLEKQCEFGPRNPGSTGHKEFANYLENFLKERFDDILIQEFEYIEPVTESLRKGKNFIVQFNQDAKYRLLIGAHWDTRAISDQDKNIEHKTLPVLGANDGGSGTAILMTLYDMFTADEPPIGIDLVFFDAEDVGRSFEGNTFAVGSEFFSKNLPIKKPDFAIIVDMVGDKQLNLPIERFSYNIAPKKVKEIWDMAEDLSLNAFEKRIVEEIYDDHVPLWENAQIPAIDIIDFKYPNLFYNHWHTQQDIPENCSPKSLEQVGTLLLNYIYVSDHK
ncbi:MAG: M28 family peptidase [Candidatus Neomarinimicrobiota bacterium]|nr:M28 family peptidase [Candidatus Neomarinimicrobiota bacterium]MEE3138877.1 M28 family peptidase [Candidatus Neomarinimicrobiota bacterium]